MRNNKIFNKMKWSLVTVAVWTMSFSPAAMGQQPSAYNYTVDQLQDNIKTLGLNKRMTLGQFFEKNKHLMPERVRKEVETAISDSRNVLMPNFEVVSAKTTTGEVIPTIRISTDRELVNLQWFGEKNKVVKYGAANISEVDIANFNDMFARVLATDANLRKQYEPKPVSRMQEGFKYPDVTRAEWKTMSLQAKVSYIQDLRAVWESANAVLAYKNQAKPKKGAQFNFEQKNNLFFELLLGKDAFARTVARPARAARTARVSSAASCLVAGYMSEYVNGVCSVERARASFANDELTRAANESCNTRQAGQIACNPFIYGTPNGEPRCITPSRTDADFQRATHFDGPCERDNHLQSAPEALDLLNDPAKRAGRYAADNLKKSIAELEAEQAAVPANIDLSKNYILGVLKFQGTTVADFNAATFTEANLDQIKTIRDKFKQDIESARQACSDVANAPGAVERNYLQACDQLHRRFLFVDAALSTRCQSGGLTYNPTSLKCSCPLAAAPAPSPAPAAPPAPPATPVAAAPAP
ncbi:MAG: hypothetical protein K2P92_01740, partial [Bdellovibrionaceae bacterium]|nr:hypothetical protein [Pseudobdellovibrionaceae bacterium]